MGRWDDSVVLERLPGGAAMSRALKELFLCMTGTLGHQEDMVNIESFISVVEVSEAG